MSLLLEGKCAVLTGCNRGIGKTILKEFACNGANIWACTRNYDKKFQDFILNLSKDNNVKIWPIYFDLLNEEQIREGVKTILGSKKPIDVLVNNAGIIFTSLFQMTPIHKMKEVFDVNFFSPMILTQTISRVMTRQRSGSIINISSSAAIEGNEGLSAYAASKSAMISATQVMAKELGTYNIKVNSIAPGFTETDLMKKNTPENVLEKVLGEISLKRIGTPEEIANVAMFLSSNLSSYITGQVISVDGGL